MKTEKIMEALRLAASLPTSQDCPQENHNLVLVAMDALTELGYLEESIRGNAAMRSCLGISSDEKIISGEPNSLKIRRYGSQISISPTDNIVEKLEKEISFLENLVKEAYIEGFWKGKKWAESDSSEIISIEEMWENSLSEKRIDEKSNEISSLG